MRVCLGHPLIRGGSVFLLCLCSGTLWAGTESGVEVDLRFVSNSVDRGQDLFADSARQRGVSYGAATGAPAFQPSLVVHTPLEGIFFQMEGFFALSGRSNRDADGYLQFGPGSDSLLGPVGDPTAPVLSCQGGFDQALLQQRLQTNDELFLRFLNGQATLEEYYTEEYGVTYGVPGYYKERNGLYRKDRLVSTLGWGGSIRPGDLEFGLSVDALVNERGKKKPVTELFFAFSPAFYSDLFLENSVDLESADTYTVLGWSRAVSLGDESSVVLDLSAGYSVTENRKGWRDYTGRLGVEVGRFSFGVNASVRPDPGFFDEDEGVEEYIPLYVTGASSSGDGLVADPGRTAGMGNELVLYTVNRALAENGIRNYTWTPRQKLPRTLFWVDAGYTFAF